MIPKHVNPGKNREALAPYNFIPLPEKVVLAEREHPGMDQSHYFGNSGYIDCVLETRSPLYIRTGMTPDFFTAWAENPRGMMADNSARNTNAEFFHSSDGAPRIPGSSLRGMLRSMVEIISYGKINWVSNDPLVFREVGGRSSLGESYRARLMKISGQTMIPLMCAGYIEKNGDDFYIIPAKKMGNGDPFYRIEWQEDFTSLPKWIAGKNTYKIQVRPGAYPSRGVKVAIATNGGTEDGVLAKSGDMKKIKRYEAVIGLPDSSKSKISIPHSLVTAYREQLSKEAKDFLGDGGVLVNQHPIFYLMEDGKLTFFAHNMMMRLPYKNTPLDLVPSHLRDNTQTDLADAIFGFVRESQKNKSTEQKSTAGRISVGDAVLIPDQKEIFVSEKPISLKILGSPKPTTFQHYLTQKSDQQKQLSTYDDLNSTVIRGHKLYWHRGDPDVKRDLSENTEPFWQNDTQHTQVRPVKAGIKFHFRVRFDNLSDVELGCLMWTLKLPAGDQKEYCHKLGMGKPLGMGSVRINPELYLIDRQERYSKLFSEDDWNLSEKNQDSQKYIQSFETYILKNLAPEVSTASFIQLQNIRMLLAMLSFPGPDPDKTRYMLIKNKDNKNEYKDRPVLPDPLGVIGEVEEQKNSENIPIPSPNQSKSPLPVNRTQQPIAPTFREAIFLKVTDISGGIIYLETASRTHIQFDYAMISKNEIGNRKFHIGDRVNCEIVKKEVIDGETVLYVRPKG